MNADFGHGLTRKKVQSELIKYLKLDARCFSSAGSGQALSEANDINYLFDGRMFSFAQHNIGNRVWKGYFTLLII